MNSAQHSLKYKLLFKFVLISVLLLLVSIGVFLIITMNQIINDAAPQVQEAALDANNTISHFFDNKKQEIMSLSFIQPINKDTTTQLFDTFLKRDKDIEELTFISPQGQEMVKVTSGNISQSNQLSNVSNTPEYTTSTFMHTKLYIGSVVNDTISLAFPVVSSYNNASKSGETTLQGIIRAQINLKSLWQLLDAIKINQEGKLFVINEKGELIHHPDVSHFPTGQLMTYMPAVRAYVRSSGQNTFQVMQAENEASQVALHFVSTVPFMHMAVIAQDPILDILTPLPRVALFFIVFFITCLLFIILLSLFLQEDILRGVQSLEEGIGIFAKGNLSYRIKSTPTNEFNSLANSLNLMANSLQLAYNNIKSDKYSIYTEREKVNYVLANVTDAVIILTKDRTITFFNRVAEAFTGYTHSEVYGKPINQIIKLFENDREVFWDEYAPLQDISPSGTYIKKKIQLQTPNIKPRLINIICVKAKFSQSQDLGFIITFHDLSEETTIDKAKADFVSLMARELLKPLSKINGYITSFRQDVSASGNTKQLMYLQGINSGVDRLSLLMENLFMVSRIENDTLTLDLQSASMSEVIKEVLPQVSSHALEKNINVSFHEPKDPLSNVRLDKTAMKDILINLFENAITFTPQNGNIDISCRQTDNEIFVQIQDMGIGIPKDMMPNLFSKFFTGEDKTRENVIGAGLGLYICKTLLEKQHGKIWADSVEGRGSVFNFSLPKA